MGILSENCNCDFFSLLTLNDHFSAGKKLTFFPRFFDRNSGGQNVSYTIYPSIEKKGWQNLKKG